MNYREMNLRVFQKKTIPHIFFQPRIEPWFHWHKIFQQSLGEYNFENITDLFDSLNCSMRYIHYYTGKPDPVKQTFSSTVIIQEKTDQNQSVRIFTTPYGELTEIQRLTIDQTWRTVDFAVKNRDDLLKLQWLYDHSEFHFDKGAFLQGQEFVGIRGEPQFWVPKSPYQTLAQIWMKLPDLIYALMDYSQVVEATMQAINRAYDPLYEEITTSNIVNIVNFGENIHEQLLSPRYLEQYLIPFWLTRNQQLHDAGIFSHVHIDGFFKHMLPFLPQLPFDGIEALTPVPQGDMTLDEIKEHIGDKILLDGIPAVLFMNTYSRERLMETTEEIINLFHPNLVLGISDELPQGADLESIVRVRMISELCQRVRT
jgi:hypothetical protein